MLCVQMRVSRNDPYSKWVSQHNVYMVHLGVTKEPVLTVIVSGKFVAKH